MKQVKKRKKKDNNKKNKQTCTQYCVIRTNRTWFVITSVQPDLTCISRKNSLTLYRTIPTFEDPEK